MAFSSFGGLGGAPGFGFAPAPANISNSKPAAFSSGNPVVGAPWDGSQKIRSIQLSYAPFVDSSGCPHMTIPAGAVGHVTDNEENCEFDAVVFDKKSAFAKPAKHRISQQRLEDAQRNNPDPDGSVPIRLLGIQELKARFSDQINETSMLSKNTQAVHALVASLEISLQAQNSRFQGLKIKNNQLQSKMLAIMRKVEVLRCLNCRLTRDELSFREKLEVVCSRVENPRQKILGLVNVEAQRDHLQHQFQQNFNSEELESIGSVLEKQRQGLQILTDVLIKDFRDIQIIKRRLES